MRILAFDDEPIALQGLINSIQQVCPEAEVCGFECAEDAGAALAEQPDVVFADIRMQEIDGITFARQLKEKFPKTDVVFTTGYSEYMEAAFELYASGYLMKPITPDKVRSALENLRYHPAEGLDRLRIQCFGNFEVFYKGKPVPFALRRTKELLAYLVDRRGAQVSAQQAESALFEDERHEAYTYKLRGDMLKTLEKIGCESAVNHAYGTLSIVPENVDCDYFDYLKNPEAGGFLGEYMSQFSWAEDTLGALMDIARME